jgi:heme exporter protein D
MNDFWAMGGYAAYVWPAYGLSVAVMVALSVAAWRNLRQKERELAQLQAMPQPGSTEGRP